MVRFNSRTRKIKIQVFRTKVIGGILMIRFVFIFIEYQQKIKQLIGYLLTGGYTIPRYLLAICIYSTWAVETIETKKSISVIFCHKIKGRAGVFTLFHF